MLIKDMLAGKTVDILIDRDDFQFRFVSKVEDVAGNSVAVSAIAASNRLFRFEETDDITLIYRATERMWKFEHVKGGLAKLEGQPVHTFTSNREAKSYNRRDSFRVPMGETCQMRYIKQETDGDKEIEKEIPFEALLCDLSAGGAGIYTNLTFELGTEIVFDLPTNLGLIGCRGNIIREADVHNKPFKHFYGINFYQVKANLEKYLFEKQRLMLQKERGG